MALGGGTYTVQNKVLGGAYFQFVSVPKATATIADRGVASIALDLNWGDGDDIITIEAREFLRDSLNILGYSYSADELRSLRELFLHAQTVHLYRLNGKGAKATSDIGTAKYNGTRGNDLKVVISKNVDDPTYFTVATYLDVTEVESQTVKSASELQDNDFIVFNKGASLEENAGILFTGGANSVSGAEDHQAFLNKIENYPDTNSIGYMGTDETLKNLYVSFTQRMRDEVGVRVQCVVHNKSADSMGVVNVKNSADLVPWALGVIAGTACNKSATNLTYDGELTINTNYTQRQLENSLKAGEWVLHRVGDKVKVLEDINSLTTITDEIGEVFQDNQTVRIIDTIADACATVFCNKYLGKVPNDANGRISLWSDIVKIHQQLNDIRALENFDPESVTVEQGESKKSVLVNSAITVVNTMVRLYMKTTIA